jgi:hypothetical protein
MGEMAMRGTRIGSVSYESEAYVEPAERFDVQYQCPGGHVTVVPMSVDAEDVPIVWTCRCGAEASAVERIEQMIEPEVKPVKPARTHWDMLLERRTIEDLEVLLEERLAELHAMPKSA